MILKRIRKFLIGKKFVIFFKILLRIGKRRMTILQVSEKNLLSAMLDFENFAKLSELKTVYHRRINGLTGTFLTFDECLIDLIIAF